MPDRHRLNRLQTRGDNCPQESAESSRPNAGALNGLSRHERIFGAKIPLLSLGEPLAQTVEHRPFKARALGSSPRRLTT